MSCILSITGTNLDIDALEQELDIGSFNKSYKGKEISKNKPNARKLAYSAMSVAVSRKSYDDFKQQTEDVTEYLKTNFSKLKIIATIAEVEDANLNFGVDYQDRFVQSKYLSPELVKLAGELNFSIEISIYTPSFRSG